MLLHFKIFFPPKYVLCSYRKFQALRSISYKFHDLRDNHNPFRQQFNLKPKPVSKFRIRQGYSLTTQNPDPHFLSYFSHSLPIS